VSNPACRRLVPAVLAAVAVWCASAGGSVAAQTDLDAFMRDVLARRDDNWKKLQQYVLDEQSTLDIRGPGYAPLWGERRDYTWYLRDGFFVRSPVKVNGVTIPEDERLEAEREYLRRVQRRDERARTQAEDADGTDDAPPLADAGSLDGLIKQTRAPEFVSSAYFLKFKFENGKYALVGREIIDNRDVLRIEYYPERLYAGTDRRRSDTPAAARDRSRDEAFRRLMNKVALVTLWVEPVSRQIVQYTFDNVGFDFLPASWFVHVDELRASMTMSQPFPDVWLPRELEMTAAFTLAVGRFDFRYALDYRDYRKADVTTRVGGVGEP
jgi:hypothetical protein